MPRDVGVILVAAGRGIRLGGDVPKQYRPIAGVPMLLRALRPFTAHSDVGHVVVVLPAEDAAAPPEFLAPLRGEMLSLVAGGAERGDSVRAGLAALAPACTVVLVHDAARPFVDQSVIDAVIARARAGTSAIAAVPLSDTLKEASTTEPDRVSRTVPRERLWRAQTPQAFPRAILERAHATAHAAAQATAQATASAPTPAGAATDDASLVEALGEPVLLVPDSPRNFKVTTADDFALAKLLAERPA